MSEFEVKIVKIDDVIKHPNADKLTIVKIGGFNCISSYLDDGSLRYKAGDLVVYIPEAAVMPEWMLQKLDFWKDGKGTLSGSQGNRVKAIKLRGVVSQGILYPVKSEQRGNGDPDVDVVYNEPDTKIVLEGDDVAEFLNIIKYEPVIPPQMRGQVGSLFGYTKSYDVENIQKYTDVFEEGEEVVFTEKLHGTLVQIGFVSDLPEDKRGDTFDIGHGVHAYVTSKGLAKQGLIQKNSETNQDNVYVKMYKKHFEETGLGNKFAEGFSMVTNGKAWRLYFFGEIYGKGVQDLGYGLNEPELKIFDVYMYNVDDNVGAFFGDLDLTNILIEFGLLRVPVLYKGPFSMETVEQFKTGNTVAGKNSHIREGIVIRPFEEKEYRGLPDNRKQLKAINPDYLLRKGETTEFN